MSASEPAILTTPEQIALYSLCALKGALRLEVLGLKRHGTSAWTLAKGIVGGKTKRETLGLLTAHVQRELARLGAEKGRRA